MDTVLNWLWQGTMVAAVAALMLRTLDRAPANVRYVVCWAVAACVVVLPVLPPLATSAVGDSLDAARTAGIITLPHDPWTSLFVLLGAWCVWASVQAARFASAIAGIRRARAASRAFPPSVESQLAHWCAVRATGRRATLVLSNSVATAAVLGSGAPLIAVAPSLVDALDAEELDRVLIHEWAHVQRRDDLANLAQFLMRLIAGWHPATWWIDRRLHVEREIACDEMAVAITGSPKSYAACLVKLAGMRGTLRSLRSAPAALSSSDLRVRVLRILAPCRSVGFAWSRGVAAAIVAVVAVMSAALGGVQLVEAAEDALPRVWPRVPDATVHRRPSVQPAALPSFISGGVRTLRATAVAQEPSSRALSTQPPPAARVDTVPDLPLAPSAGALPATPIAEPGAHATVAKESNAVPHGPGATAEGSTSPWSAAASGGVAIGRKSKDAGVATAGFFTRTARRIAGSF